MKKGDIVLINFAFDIIEAKIVAVYGDKYIKVRHRANITDWIFPYYQIVEISRVVEVKNNG